MSTTTQILFNSPALHSLKREQLVKLCKIHSIKASGKNIELIQKLKQHAQTLPKDSPLSIAARSETTVVPTHPFNCDSDKTEDEGIAEKDDSSDYQGSRHQIPRPSEQWEVVMESIEELEEHSSQGTLSSMRTLGNHGNNGEFGTTGSKSSTSTVGSSFRALANSLGLKRNHSSKSNSSISTGSMISSFPIQPPPIPGDELTENSIPYAALPHSTPPQTDHFTFDPSSLLPEIIDAPDNPLPGHALRPGIPAPVNARLSLGLGLGAPSTPTRPTQPTTTIRLISNPFSNAATGNNSYCAGEHGTPQLKPFATTFDLILGSPISNGAATKFGSMNIWPPRDPGGDMVGIYPTLTTDDLPPVITHGSTQVAGNGSVSRAPTEGLLTPPRNAALTASSIGGNIGLNPPITPFVFGSPLPQHNVTNTQFRAAAASVLEEMNKRLQHEGVDGVGLDIIAKLHPGAHSVEDLTMSRNVKPLPGSRRGDIKEKFEKMHEVEFNKMEGIDGLLKRRAERSPTRNQDDSEKPMVGKKRKSSALGRDRDGRRLPGAIAGRVSGTRVISNGRRARVLPGAFGGDDDDNDDDEENEERGGKRTKVESDATEELEKQKEEEDLRQKEREREAIKRRLEINKAKRRSSVAAGGLVGRRSGRVSVGRGGTLTVKPKPSRFGFLSSAKSLVQNVWNRNKAAPSNIPKPAAPVKPELSEKAPAPAVLKKASGVPARPTTTQAVAIGSRIPSIRIANKEKDKNVNGTIATSSSRSRSPLPSFGPAASTKSSLAGTATSSGTGTRASRNSSQAGTSRTNSLAGTGVSRTSSTGISSMGTRLSVKNPTGNIGSLGSKMVGTASSRTSAVGSSSSRLSSRSSRLFAPTASSLAKMARNSTAGQKATEDQGTKGPPKKVDGKPSALSMITNSPAVPSPSATKPGPFSPRSDGIFNSPLKLPSGIPTPVKRLAQTNEASAEESAGVVRQRSFGRKPRISRSKVIARLASQRAAGTSGSSSGAGVVTHGIPHGGRTRSSLGAKMQRTSVGGGKRRSGAGDVLMSAKKRARQSEYARRRSRIDAESGGSRDIDMSAD